MSEHDKFCAIWTSDGVCICGYLKDARTDEREQAAQRVRAWLILLGVDEEVRNVVVAAARGEDTK